MTIRRKLLTATFAAVTLGAAAMATTTQAQAFPMQGWGGHGGNLGAIQRHHGFHRGCCRGGGFGRGLGTGLAIGFGMALLNEAIAAARQQPEPQPQAQPWSGYGYNHTTGAAAAGFGLANGTRVYVANRATGNPRIEFNPNGNKPPKKPKAPKGPRKPWSGSSTDTRTGVTTTVVGHANGTRTVIQTDAQGNVMSTQLRR
jgi:hypothetical protein